MSNLKQLDKQHIMGTYARFDVAILNGKQATCYDENGKKYIDFTAGIGVNSLGFSDDEWVAAVAKQAGTLQHISNLYYTEPDVALAQALTEVTGYQNVLFCNSGAEANECAIKIARKYSFDKYGTNRDKIITLINSFHGRTVTTLSATGQDVFHNYFFPFTEGFVYVPANDMEALKKALTDDVCAVMYEPVQGEGGVLPLEKEFVQEMSRLCAQKDILLVSDEVQTGVSRTGTFLANEQLGVVPDVVSLAKGLGGGLPIGAVMCNQKTATVLGFGDHGTTFGGNPICCAGALVCVKRLSDSKMLQSITEKAKKIRDTLSGLDEVESVSGLGLMVGIKLKTKSAKEVVGACLKEGLLVLTAKDKVRLLPPLTITEDELEQGLAILIKQLQAE